VSKPRILLVDDDIRLLKIIREILECEGYRVTTKSSGEAAIEALHSEAFDVVITDLEMGQTDGIAVLRETRRANPETRVLLFTGSHVDPIQLGADDYVSKPCRLNRLCQKVAGCLENSVNGRMVRLSSS
jgi:DNA-binding response OmpR family regulator